MSQGPIDRMHTLRRIAVFVVLPVVGIMMTAGALYHFYGSSEAIEAAQRRLDSSSQLAAELLDRRVSHIDESLSYILVQESLSQYAMFQNAGLRDEAEDFRLEIEQTLMRLAESDPNIASIELFTPQGERFVAVENGERTLQPKDVGSESWFTRVNTAEFHVGFVDNGRVRFAKSSRMSGDREPFAVVAVLYDLRGAVYDAGQFAIRHLNQAGMQLADSAGVVLYTYGLLSFESGYLESAAALSRPSGRVIVRQAKPAALSSFGRASSILYAALAAITVGLVIVAAGGTHMVVRDVRAAQRQAAASEQMAKDNEARVRAVVDHAADAIITVGKNRQIQSINPAAREMFGYSNGEANGLDIALLVPSLTVSSLADRTRQPANEAGASTSQEIEGHRKDGSVFEGELSISQVALEKEQLFALIVRDISARKEAEEQMRQLDSERASRQRIESLLTRVREAVERLATSSQQILETTSSQAKGFTEQAASVSKMTAIADELERTVDNSLRAASKVAMAAERSRSAGAEGQEALLETISTMSEAKVRVEAVATCIIELVESTHAINEITTSVNDIAEQTNVLALNAAVEASRAGEHGRGFAVVAQEVKQLAAQAKSATEQVRQILSKVLHSLQGAVDSAEQGTALVSQAADIVTNSGDLMQELVSALSESASAALQISNASHQQSQTVTEVHAAMRQINDVALRSSAAIREINKNVEDLTKLSQNLAQIAVEFD